MGFLQNYLNRLCFDNALEMASSIIDAGAIKLVDKFGGMWNSTNRDDLAQKLARSEAHLPDTDQFCVSGCYPVPYCDNFFSYAYKIMVGEEPYCSAAEETVLTTNCMQEVEKYLFTYFVYYVIIDL